MIDVKLSAALLAVSFWAWNVFVVAASIGLACGALIWALTRLTDAYTLIRSIQEAYRQGRDPWWPCWRRKAKEMQEEQR